MPDRDPTAWVQRLDQHRRPPPDDLHDTRGHWQQTWHDGPRCASCRTPWPCTEVTGRMQRVLTAGELAELERRITTRDYDPIAPHRAAGYAWDSALEILCAYIALQADHHKALMRVTALQDLLDAAEMEAG